MSGFTGLHGIGSIFVINYGGNWIELIFAFDSLCLAICDRALLRPHSIILWVILAVLAFPPS
jgi:hypothetical protein